MILLKVISLLLKTLIKKEVNQFSVKTKILNIIVYIKINKMLINNNKNLINQGIY